MRSPYILPPIICGVALLVTTQPQLAQALSATEVSTIAEAITVRIDGQNPGSGVLIKHQDNTYTVLTAKHVVATEDEYEMVTPDQQRYPLTYSRVTKLPGVDLALVEFNSSKTYQVAELADSAGVKAGESIYVSGFPMPTAAITKSIWNFSAGQVTANASQPLEDGYALVYSNNTLPGMSGGPVLNERGRLIGIHGRADTTAKVQDQGLNPDIYIKSGFNLGIPTHTFLRLLPETRFELGFAAPVAQPSTQAKADDFFLRAQAQIGREEYQEAITTLDQAISLNPNYSAAYALRGFAHARLGKASAALADSEQAIRLDPKTARAYLVRGLVRLRIGEVQEALADANEGIRLQPNFAGGYGLRGTVNLLLEDYASAVADLKMTAKLMRAQGDIAQAKSLEQGIPAFSQLTQGQGTFKHYLSRASVRIQLKDKSGAVSDLQAAAALASQQKEIVQYLLAKSMLRITDANAAQRYANQDKPQAVFTDSQAMLSYLNQSIQRGSKDANSYRIRGLLLAEIFNRPQQALPDIQKAAAFYRDQKDTSNYEHMTSYIEALQD